MDFYQRHASQYKIQNIEAKKSLVVQVHKNVILELYTLKKVFIAYDVTTHNHNHNLCTLLQQLTAHLPEGCGAALYFDVHTQL